MRAVSLLNKKCEGAGFDVTMCTGHSVGFHRRLIHRTFKCGKWTERALVWSGTMVGMQGPFWVIRSHDIRDWAQRQHDCHALLKHGGHHAFPASARHGLYPGQLDLGYDFVRLLERLGLAWDVQTPDTLPPRLGITQLRVAAE